MVAWKDAISYLTVQINIMKSEKKDLWLGLKQVAPGPERWFWFNIRDEMSFWMTAEEQMQYKHCLSLPREEQPAKWLLPSAFRHVIEEVAPVVSNVKSGRRKRRSTFGEIDTPTAASLAKSKGKAQAPQQKGGKVDVPLDTATSPATSRKLSLPADVSAIVGSTPDSTENDSGKLAAQPEQYLNESAEAVKDSKTAHSSSKIPYNPKYAAPLRDMQQSESFS